MRIEIYASDCRAQLKWHRVCRSDKLFQDSSGTLFKSFWSFFRRSANETPKKSKKYFNFIHFLSAKFNFFDASRYFSNCPRGMKKGTLGAPDPDYVHKLCSDIFLSLETRGNSERESAGRGEE